MQDLPIGVDPNATYVTVGAPPDQYNTLGQDWGLPPFIPHKLRAAAYEPFRQTIGATLRHAGGLRIDHVMGLFRLYWIPQGMDPSLGAYVQYAADELLAMVTLESQRARRRGRGGGPRHGRRGGPGTARHAPPALISPTVVRGRSTRTLS
jgi:4-alpha-glucanotransferase